MALVWVLEIIGLLATLAIGWLVMDTGAMAPRMEGAGDCTLMGGRRAAGG